MIPRFDGTKPDAATGMAPAARLAIIDLSRGSQVRAHRRRARLQQPAVFALPRPLPLAAVSGVICGLLEHHYLYS